MPVQVVWDDDAQTIIRQVYSGHIGLDDYYHATDEFVRLAQSVEHTVHSIMDRREVIFSEGSYLRVLRYANNKLPDNIGLRVVINASVMTRILINIGTRIAPRLISNIQLVDTLEEAYALIQQHAPASSG